MKRLAIPILFAIAASSAQAQTMRGHILDYLDHYSRTDQYFKRSTLDSLCVNDSTQTITMYASGGFKEQFFTDPIVADIYKSVSRFVPDSLSSYRLRIITDRHPIEELVPNAIRKGEKSADRLWHDEYKGAPWTRNISSPLSAPKGLEGSHLALWQSHGTYWKQAKQAWMWQRPHLFCTTEDLFTQTFVVPYIIPMLENAGAVVYTPRERNWQNKEVIVDNDAPEKNGIYEEKGKWHTSDSAGFAHLKDIYYASDHPFSDGTVRYAKTDVIRSSSSRSDDSRNKESRSDDSRNKDNRSDDQQNSDTQIRWTPDIPEEGEYAVYVSYQTLPQSIDDAAYTVVHKGIATEFRVNQRMGGSTWVYLGTFTFAPGCNSQNCVVLSNSSHSEGVVTADAVRFGSGYGNIARGETVADTVNLLQARLSGMPRWAEAARYFAQWAGMPDTIYNHFRSDDDYSNDIWARPETANTLAGGSVYMPRRPGRGVPFELTMGFHSDAGFNRTNTLVGSLAICTSDTAYTQGRLNAGIDRFASYDLASLLLRNLSVDMKKYQWRVRQLWNRNYGETRISELPSIILEMLSHQNFTDLTLGYDPQFKFDFCRSVYKTVVKYIAAQHSRDYVIQPLPVHNFAITLNDQDKWANLTWDATVDSLEPTASPDQYIVYTRIDDRDFDNGTVVSGTSYLAPLEKGHLYSFKVVAMNQGGISFPSETLCAYAAEKNQGTILIVNAFTRLEGPKQVNTATDQGFDIDADPGVPYGKFPGFCGRQLVFDKTNMGSETSDGTGYSSSELEGTIMQGNTFDYVSLHSQGISALGNHSFCSSSEEALVGNVVVPGEYTMVDLICGVQTHFRKETAAKLDDYIRHGGRLLISGANLFNGPDFAFQQLHATYGTEIKDKTISSVNGSGLTFSIYREMNPRSYAVPRVMSLQPSDSAFAMLQYSDGQPAAIAYDGTDSKVITVGFPIESIQEPDNRNLLMQAITKFLCQ